MRESPYRAQVTAIVTSELEDMGVAITPGILSAALLRLALGEDLVLDFIPGVERRLGIVSPAEPWKKVFTVSRAIDVWCRALEERDQVERWGDAGD
jgi:hypothetical protein